jgi:hypothetical protein
MAPSRATPVGDRIIEPMIALAGCSKQHRIVVAGSKAVELMLELHRRGYARAYDGKPILRRHLIAFLLDLYLVHRRLQFRYGIFPFGSILILSPVQKLRDMEQGATGWLDGRLRTPYHKRFPLYAA